MVCFGPECAFSKVALLEPKCFSLFQFGSSSRPRPHLVLKSSSSCPRLQRLYSYYLHSLQRLSTRVCKYFRPESLPASRRCHQYRKIVTNLQFVCLHKHLKTSGNPEFLWNFDSSFRENDNEDKFPGINEFTLYIGTQDLNRRNKLILEIGLSKGVPVSFSPTRSIIFFLHADWLER